MLSLEDVNAASPALGFRSEEDVWERLPQASPAALEAAGGFPLRPGEPLDLDEDFLLSFVLNVVSIPLRFSGLVPRGVTVGETFGTGNTGGAEFAFEMSLAGDAFLSLGF